MNQFSGDPRIAIPLVIGAFAYHQDHREWDQALAMATPDFVIEKYGRVFDIPTLRALWASWIEDRVVMRQVRTMWRFVEFQDNLVKTSSYGLTFMSTEADDGSVAALHQAKTLTEYYETFSLGQEGWKLQHRLAMDVLETKAK